MDTAKTYRIIGFTGGRERTVAAGLTKERAEEKLEFLKANPLKGMSFCLESEAAAQYWEGFVATAGPVQGR